MKLTDTQLMMLSKASQRADRAVECPSNLKRGALKAVVTKLLDRGLVNEVAAKRGMPAWRHDDNGGSFALVITLTGLKAIAAEPDEPAEADPAAGDAEAESGSGVRGRKRGGAAPADEPRKPRTAPMNVRQQARAIPRRFQVGADPLDAAEENLTVSGLARPLPHSWTEQENKLGCCRRDRVAPPLAPAASTSC